MIPNHPEPEQILLENVLFALGNPAVDYPQAGRWQ